MNMHCKSRARTMGLGMVKPAQKVGFAECRKEKITETKKLQKNPTTTTKKRNRLKRNDDKK